MSELIRPAPRQPTPEERLRDMANGSLASDMLSEDGRAFTSTCYAPEYGYPSDHRRVFGRGADGYAVPDGWESYHRRAPGGTNRRGVLRGRRRRRCQSACAAAGGSIAQF